MNRAPAGESPLAMIALGVGSVIVRGMPRAAELVEPPRSSDAGQPPSPTASVQ